MRPELIAIIGIGVALAVALVPGQRAMRRAFAALQERVLNLEAKVRERIAHLEGVIEGLVRRQQEGAA